MRSFLLFLSISIVGHKICSQTTSEEFEYYIIKEISKPNVAGMGIAIINKDSVLLSKGYGYADIYDKIPFSNNTVMNIASISKTLIGVSIMYAIENNLLGLDDSVNELVPFSVINPYYPDEPIMLKHLMGHRSGIKDEDTIYKASYHYGGDSPVRLDVFLKDYLSPNGKHYSNNNFIDKRPGEFYEYSNIGAGLAAHILGSAFGRPFNVLTREMILQPLEMDDTYWFFSEMADPSKHSKLYRLNKDTDTLTEVEPYGLTTYPDGGLRTTISDLSNYLSWIMNNGSFKGRSIIRESSLAEMLRSDHSTSYGKFWSIGTRIGHGGWDPGVTTGMYFYPEEGLGIIIFLNSSSYHDFTELEKMVLDHGRYLLRRSDNSLK